MKRAIIDIGTNTAHLLIAEVKDGRIMRVLDKKRFYTFLGEAGMHQISEMAIGRLIDALNNFQSSLKTYNCHKIHVIATEGLRAASNAKTIYDLIINQFQWPIRIISGDEEADLIYKGVRLSLDLNASPFLIMDIGGGSVEFIFVLDGKRVFQQSFPIGISRLYEAFHIHDPCTEEDLVRMYKYLDEALYDLWQNLPKDFRTLQLVGCAGTFEVFLTDHQQNDPEIKTSRTSTRKVRDLLQKVMRQDLNQRSLVKDLPKNRAKYIVVALALIKYVTDHIKAEDFVVSKYALKEGAITTNDYF